MSHVKDVTFHLLTHEDAVELLQFERAERAWFEQHIEARPECFYTLQGVAKHIIDCLAPPCKAEKAKVLDSVFTNVWLPCLPNQEAGKHSNITIGNVSDLCPAMSLPLHCTQGGMWR